MKRNLQELPKLRDSISYVYIEHSRIEQDSFAIAYQCDGGTVHVPIASITCLMLGPGTSITHAAIKTISENGCMIVWCGEHCERFYAYGNGETRSAKNLLVQAKKCMDAEQHIEVVKRMYNIRFPKMKTDEMTLEQIRGLEGIRVKQAYRIASRQFGIAWKGRNYKTKKWENSDRINMALSEANSILYSVCHAAIVSLGYSPGLGFIHTGKALSFVYDIADIYKAETTIPAAFEAASEAGELPSLVRRKCRKYFGAIGILKRIAKDIEDIFSIGHSEEDDTKEVGDLWDERGSVQGGINHGGD